MNKEWSILDITSKVGILLVGEYGITPNIMLDILRDPKPADEIQIKKSFMDIQKFMKFLLDNESRIIKPKLLMYCLRNYSKHFEETSLINYRPEEIKEAQAAKREALEMLKGIKSQMVYYKWKNETSEMTDMIVVSSYDEPEKITGTRKKNRQRLEGLEKEENFTNIIQAIQFADIGDIISPSKAVGDGLKTMIIYNALLKNKKYPAHEIREIFKKRAVIEKASELSWEEIVPEMENAISKNIDKLDFDTILLNSAFRYIEALEEKRIREEDVEIVYSRLKTILKHTKPNARLMLMEKDDKTGETTRFEISAKNIREDMGNFIVNDGRLEYITKKESEEIIKQLREGTLNLSDFSEEKFEVLKLTPAIKAEILSTDPNNYIYFLKTGKGSINKERLLEDIIKSKQCSQELLQLICQRGYFGSKEILELFDKGIISAQDIDAIKDTQQTIITDRKMLEKYEAFKMSDKKEEDKIELERYALLYRVTETLGKTTEEQVRKGDEFMSEMGEKIETSDLVPLYTLGIIPLQTAVDWGGENIVEELVSTESLKPADAKKLYELGLLDDTIIEEIFRKQPQMSYSYQFMLVNTIFSDLEIKERLSQYYNLEMGIKKASKIVQRRTNTKDSQINKNEEQPQKRINVRDPGTKLELLSSLDPEYTIEEGIVDGHFIFHYPNIRSGTVLIEKMHNISSRGATRGEIKVDNQSATYIMSEEEFIKMKSILIDDGRIDRTILTQKWWVTRDPEHWIAHTGISGWENAIQNYFDVREGNSRYSEGDIKHFEEIKAKAISERCAEEK